MLFCPSLDTWLYSLLLQIDACRCHKYLGGRLYRGFDRE
jgi:hypothetical protein